MVKTTQPAIKPPTSLDDDRKMLALESVWEIEVLASLLLDKAESEDWELEHEPAMILRNLGIRIKTLSRVAMAAIDDPAETTHELAQKVFGRGVTPDMRPHQAA